MPLLHVGNQSLAIFANQRVTNPDFERQYEQRHVLLATAEDVLVTSTPIDSAYLEYLDSLVGIPEIVVAGRHDQVCLAKNILGDPETLRQLRRAIDGREFILLPFMATPQIDQVAALLGIDVLGSSDLSEHFN
ncbi:TPA: hypothetical protein DHW58_00275, partial [Patescibacteria group bacterium]|nr:hypothetical protein [Patescibacteria group bacterium]